MGETCAWRDPLHSSGNDRFVCGRSRTVGESRRFVTRSRVDENAKSHIVSGCRSCNRIKCYSRRTFGEGGLDVDNKDRIGIVTKYRKESVADISVTLSLFWDVLGFFGKHDLFVIFVFLRACLNFAQVRFESSFRGYFSVFTRRISYLTRENGKKDRKKTQKWPDDIFFVGKFRQAIKDEL